MRRSIRKRRHRPDFLEWLAVPSPSSSSLTETKTKLLEKLKLAQLAETYDVQRRESAAAGT